MAKAGERAAPNCPRCGKRLRIKPGTTRFTPGEKLRFQCKSCLATHPNACEWHPAMLAFPDDLDDSDEE